MKSGEITSENDSDIIYQENKDEGKKSFYGLVIFLIIGNIVFIYFGLLGYTRPLILFIILESISIIPLMVMIYHVIFIDYKPTILTKDKLSGKFTIRNLKTDKSKEINEIKFDLINSIYFANMKLDNNIYIKYKKNYQIKLLMTDKKLIKDFKKVFFNKYKDKIIKIKQSDKTYENQKQSYFIIWMVCIIVISILPPIFLYDKISGYIWFPLGYVIVVGIISAIILGVKMWRLSKEYKDIPDKIKVGSN